MMHHPSAGTLVLSQRVLASTLVVLLVAVTAFYLMLVNVRVTKGFEIRDLETKIAQLQKDQKQLELETADLQSINNIEKKVDLGAFVPAANVQYLKDSSFAVTSAPAP